MMLIFPFGGKILSITRPNNTFPTGGKSSQTSDVLGVISHANSDYTLKTLLTSSAGEAW